MSDPDPDPDPDPDLAETTLADRVALLGVTDLAMAGRTPAHSGEIRRTCLEHVEALEGEVVGRPSEADVMRALNRLVAEGLLEEVQSGDASPVGKGRPEYDLTGPAEPVLSALAGDDRLGPLTERLRE
jgi:hypothetical protein